LLYLDDIVFTVGQLRHCPLYIYVYVAHCYLINCRTIRLLRHSLASSRLHFLVLTLYSVVFTYFAHVYPLSLIVFADSVNIKDKYVIKDKVDV
uniref:Uncharacterized protein n=1 Tax=Ciona intestinalis TaxID=7719 RepID=H2XKN1_CIOIN